MSEEEARETVSGWTVETLRHLTETLIRAHEQNHETANRAGLMIWDDHRREHLAEHVARDKAIEALSIRLDAAGQARDQIREQQVNFVTREVLDAIVGGLVEKFDGLRGKWESMAARIDKSEGKSFGLSSGWNFLVSGIAAAMSIITMITVVFFHK